ncbi:phosphonate degradation associated HDIG domain protein [Herbaspirillum seropedicae]|jgi:phosphonate degradation associated HDIG domain protein|uniref:phosphonate degradation HD-domain oxygenase n=1 Tax=Herbaspirillum seropedicae TaxID=964 RepID=UPI0008481879|nr:phosphonate degradation HD-domain oxygenase [Herbaspirillum seropedicae]AON53486.1 HD phosphohydrolase [Herbaspirillum seropedicae]MDR6396556.1 phosphonate degradation associated HDIG domain protein [Herbaspirillum seropedicae]
MALSLDDVAVLFARHGHTQYAGEPVTQLEHALQTALLAEQQGASASLIVASLLHDLGHMLEDLGDTPTLSGVDDLHQWRIQPFLRGLFGDEVLAPIALHVDAKRYLCATDPGYFGALSADSVRSLALQGGIFDVEQAAAFIDRPYARDAVRLRRWDDQAKTAGLATPDYQHFSQYFQQCLCPASGAAAAHSR